MTVSNLTFFYGKRRRLCSCQPRNRGESRDCADRTLRLRQIDFLADAEQDERDGKGSRAEGEILLDNENILEMDVSQLRRRVGMVFQRPNPFPKSIFDNIAYGPRINGMGSRSSMAERVEASLRRAALWDEVKDKLHKSAFDLSGGQQQRLCIARALAVNPEVLLLDEPCSALDPIATAKIEELLFHIKENCTVVIVTHNMQQAARVSDSTAFMLNGERIEFSPTPQLFTTPPMRTEAYHRRSDEAYITGRFGLQRERRTHAMERHFERDLERAQRAAAVDGKPRRACRASVHPCRARCGRKARRSVLDEEPVINELQMEMDDRVVQLLALYQLMAADLRFVLAVSRINNDLERIGDQAVNISQAALRDFAASTREALRRSSAHERIG